MAEQNELLHGSLNGVAQRELVISRVFNAPREVVFRMWTEPGHLQRWWGPKGASIRVAALDVRPGGVFLYSMDAPDGMVWGRFVYREVAAPERLVFVNSFSDDQGSITRAPFSPVWPLEILNTLILREHDGATMLTLRGGPINATEAERKAYESALALLPEAFAGTFDQLDSYLATIRTSQ